jgi:mannan endo-1,4-beta-mannosidase
VYLPGYQLDPAGALGRYAELAGHPPAIVHWFQHWLRDSEFQPGPMLAVRELDALPMISWEPHQGLGPIAAGKFDAYIQRYAAACAESGQPLLLRFAHEMNLSGIPWFGPPPMFREAWHRVRSIFLDAGATRVAFVWSPYVLGRNAAPFDAYYPEEADVDWVALDGYNWGRRRWWQRWPTFDRVFSSSYRSLVELAPGKPMMLAELGCTARGGDKAAWMRDALLSRIPAAYPEISAVVWFNHFPPGHEDWRLDSSPGALAVWRAVVADPRYAISGKELAIDSQLGG